MSLDEFQQAWQSQDTGRQVRIDAELLLRELRHSQRSFKSTIFWRDIREIKAAVFVIIVSVGAACWVGWPWLSLAAASIWIVGFLLVDRWRQRRGETAVQQSLIACLDESLREVEHQIRLLRNVAWWYFLPAFVACLIALAYTVSILDPMPLLVRAIVFLIGLVFLVAVYYGLYRLNQRAVRNCLEPRRQELLAMRDSLVQPEE